MNKYECLNCKFTISTNKLSEFHCDNCGVTYTVIDEILVPLCSHGDLLRLFKVSQLNDYMFLSKNFLTKKLYNEGSNRLSKADKVRLKYIINQAVEAFKKEYLL